MGNIDNTLSKKIKQLGIERQVEAAGVVESATKIISEFIDPEDFEVVSFNRGTLKIITSSTVVSCEINALKSKFKRLGINNLLCSSVKSQE